MGIPVVFDFVVSATWKATSDQRPSDRKEYEVSIEKVMRGGINGKRGKTGFQEAYACG